MVTIRNQLKDDTNFDLPLSWRDDNKYFSQRIHWTGFVDLLFYICDGTYDEGGRKKLTYRRDPTSYTFSGVV